MKRPLLADCGYNTPMPNQMASQRRGVSMSKRNYQHQRRSQPGPGYTSKRRYLPWRRRIRELLSQEIPIKYLVSHEDGWEMHEYTSRDAETRLRKPVFFSSIDQRDDRAGRESLCTSGGAPRKPPAMPIWAELDTLIRTVRRSGSGSAATKAHMEQFPNMHFDQDMVLAAMTRPVAGRHDRALVGFFQPELCVALGLQVNRVHAADRCSSLTVSRAKEDSLVYYGLTACPAGDADVVMSSVQKVPAGKA